MELRHLRHFLGVAEELHFGRAAERLHIEQSPLSRSIKELEIDLGIKLFHRTTRRTHLTDAGKIFLDEAKRILDAVDQARSCMKKTALTGRTSLRIAVTSNFSQPQLSKLIERCRSEEPELELCITEMPANNMITALKTGQIDAGITPIETHDTVYFTEPIWNDSLSLAVPPQHPLSELSDITLEDILQQPLIFNDPSTYLHFSQRICSSVHQRNKQAILSTQVTSLEMMLILVIAGSGIGFATSSQLTSCHRPSVIVRPLPLHIPLVTTYLLRPRNEISERLLRFSERARQVGQI